MVASIIYHLQEKMTTKEKDEFNIGLLQNSPESSTNMSPDVITTPISKWQAFKDSFKPPEQNH